MSSLGPSTSKSIAPPSGKRGARKGHPCLTQRYLGQEASIESSVLLVSLPVIQLVSSFHSVPDPTAAGMRSEPSKRKTELGSCRICTDFLSIGFATLARSRPLLAETQLPSLARVLACCELAR